MRIPAKLLILSLFFITGITWLTLCQATHYLPTPYAQPSDVNEHATPTAPNQPSNKKFLQLQIELGRYEIAAQKSWALIPEHPLYKLGKHYDSISLLRDRLNVTGDLNQTESVSADVYDAPLVEAIKQFQNRHGLKDDGIPGKLTLAELNVTPQSRIRSIQINIQRLAILSKQLGDRYIIVNIPDYQLYLLEHGQQIMSMKAIVGKPTLQTPELSSRITRVILNPYWHVPDKIAADDIAPKVRDDPYYLSDMHIRVFIRKSGHSEEVNGNDIDWEHVESDSTPYDFRQEPGDDNALGLVKFEFPNPYNVYLHDTAVKSLFTENIRDLSHGCIRLERPFDLVNYLLKDNPEWDEQDTQDVLATHQTKYISVKKPIQLYITYLTVWTDENGVVNYRNDIYQRDI